MKNYPAYLFSREMTLLYLWGLILLLTAIAIAGAVTVCRAAELSPKPEAQALTPEKLASLESRKELFHYDALERPDPFRPFINFSQIERSIPTDATRSLSPLEKYALNQFNLVGIILAGDNNNYALVEDPDHTGYTVREGDKIGNLSGQVQSIESNAVIIEEPYLDIFDKRQVRTISLKLREIDESADLATQIK